MPVQHHFSICRSGKVHSNSVTPLCVNLWCILWYFLQLIYVYFCLLYNMWNYLCVLQPSGKGKRLPEVHCIVSKLGCFNLFAKVKYTYSMSASALMFLLIDASVGSWKRWIRNSSIHQSPWKCVRTVAWKLLVCIRMETRRHWQKILKNIWVCLSKKE